METTNFLLCLVAILVSSVIGSPINNGQTVNGVVRLLHKGGCFCGGTLVAPDYVVTAAHCVEGKNMDGFTVVANITSISESGIQRKVSNISQHPEYNITNFHSDVAVLKLNESILNIPTVKLCERPLEEGNIIQVTGWGRFSEKKSVSTTLRTVPLSVSSLEACKEKYTKLVAKNMFCAYGEEGKSACGGSSGGLGAFNQQLCGILAFTHNCGVAGSLQGYTDVYAVKPFIESIIWPNRPK